MCNVRLHFDYVQKKLILLFLENSLLLDRDWTYASAFGDFLFRLLLLLEYLLEGLWRSWSRWGDRLDGRFRIFRKRLDFLFVSVDSFSTARRWVVSFLGLAIRVFLIRHLLEILALFRVNYRLILIFRCFLLILFVYYDRDHGGLRHFSILPYSCWYLRLIDIWRSLSALVKRISGHDRHSFHQAVFTLQIIVFTILLYAIIDGTFNAWFCQNNLRWLLAFQLKELRVKCDFWFVLWTRLWVLGWRYVPIILQGHMTAI